MQTTWSLSLLFFDSTVLRNITLLAYEWFQFMESFDNMDHIDKTQAFLLIEPRSQLAEDAFALPRNHAVRVQQDTASNVSGDDDLHLTFFVLQQIWLY